MYIPNKLHWVGPVSTILAGCAVQQGLAWMNHTPGQWSWDVFLIVQLPLTRIAMYWADYINRAGIVYQEWEARPTTTAEQEGIIQAKARAMADGYVQVGGNAGTVIERAHNVQKHTITPRMVENQYIAETPAIDYLRLDIKKICKRQLTLRDHPELGYPDGDYREKTWVVSGILPRTRLINVVDTLKHNQGIDRKGEAKNSPYVTVNWNVIQLGAQGERLPLPAHLQ